MAAHFREIKAKPSIPVGISLDLGLNFQALGRAHTFRICIMFSKPQPFQSRSIRHDDSGAVAIIFAITLVVVVMIGGMALDYARGISTRTDIQAAEIGRASCRERV